MAVAGVLTRIVATMVRGGEKFYKVSVSGRARWVSERGYDQMQKMVKEGASAVKIRTAMKDYTIKKTLGYRKTVTTTDSAGILKQRKIGVLGKKRIMIRNIAKAMNKTGVPKNTQKEIIGELEKMSEKEIYDFFSDPDNKGYLDVTFRYKEKDDDGNTIDLEEAQTSNAQLRTFKNIKKSNAVNLLGRLRARHQTVLS